MSLNSENNDGDGFVEIDCTVDEFINALKRASKAFHERKELDKLFCSLGALYFYSINKDFVTAEELEIIGIKINDTEELINKVCEENENIKECIGRINKLLNSSESVDNTKDKENKHENDYKEVIFCSKCGKPCDCKDVFCFSCGSILKK